MCKEVKKWKTRSDELTEEVDNFLQEIRSRLGSSNTQQKLENEVNGHGEGDDGWYHGQYCGFNS